MSRVSSLTQLCAENIARQSLSEELERFFVSVPSALTKHALHYVSPLQLIHISTSIPAEHAEITWKELCEGHWRNIRIRSSGQTWKSLYFNTFLQRILAEVYANGLHSEQLREHLSHLSKNKDHHIAGSRDVWSIERVLSCLNSCFSSLSVRGVCAQNAAVLHCIKQLKHVGELTVSWLDRSEFLTAVTDDVIPHLQAHVSRLKLTFKDSAFDYVATALFTRCFMRNVRVLSIDGCVLSQSVLHDLYHFLSGNDSICLASLSIASTVVSDGIDRGYCDICESDFHDFIDLRMIFSCKTLRSFRISDSVVCVSGDNENDPGVSSGVREVVLCDVNEERAGFLPEFMKSLLGFTALRVIDFQGISLKGQLAGLCYSIEKGLVLESISLSECGLLISDVEGLCVSLKTQSRSYSLLDISSNYFGFELLRNDAFHWILQHFRVVKVRNCGLGIPENSTAAGSAFEFPEFECSDTLHTIDLSENRLKRLGGEVVAALLKSSVEHIICDGNCMKNDSLSRILDGFREIEGAAGRKRSRKRVLETLSIKDNMFNDENRMYAEIGSYVRRLVTNMSVFQNKVKFLPDLIQVTSWAAHTCVVDSRDKRAKCQ